MPSPVEPFDFTKEISSELHPDRKDNIKSLLEAGKGKSAFDSIRDRMPDFGFADVLAVCRTIRESANNPKILKTAIEVLTLLNDRRYSTGLKKRSHILHIVRIELDKLFGSLPSFDEENSSGVTHRLIDYPTRKLLRAPKADETTLVIHADIFPPEGNECDAALLVDAYMKGWRKFICYDCSGQRYIGCGLGPGTDEVFIDVYGSSGDYLGSGICGLTITVHGNAQDQLGQIIKRGKMVIYGDTGQTFMYGAKGGEVYIMGNAAGRPLINSVGKPRVIINGTSLDFLAESFMAGNPNKGGGFVILNAIRFDDEGNIIPLPEPYPGSNMFSLASGGAIFIRDPYRICVDGQLNGGVYLSLTQEDWELILPYLEENERLFGIKVDDLLTVDGRLQPPEKVYRKVVPLAVGKAIAEKERIMKEQETVGDLYN
jgi:glutamate synthase domain-containing protein 3